jgi:hypothetical protein
VRSCEDGKLEKKAAATRRIVLAGPLLALLVFLDSNNFSRRPNKTVPRSLFLFLILTLITV